MKRGFHSILLSLFLFSLIVFVLSSCSENEIQIDEDAGKVILYNGFAPGAGARIVILADENLFAGYNPLTIALYDSVTGKVINDAHLHIDPVMTMRGMSHSCPVENPLINAGGTRFSGALFLTMPSTDMSKWKITVSVHNQINGKSGRVSFEPAVLERNPPAYFSFTSGQRRVFVACHFPLAPHSGVNEVEFVAFMKTAEGFVPAANLAFSVSPAMPSMDHGSPNNIDPAHAGAGHYKGSVNFTMTGQWKLNVIVMEGASELVRSTFDVVVR